MKLGISRNHDCIHETQLSVVNFKFAVSFVGLDYLVD
jgi:hypothetical protein